MIRKLYYSKRSILFLLLLITTQVFAQKTITGKVTDKELGEPLVGVSIRINDSSTRGTLTDLDGNYLIAVSAGETLVFSYIGMETTEVVINGQSIVNVEMSTSLVLDEVIVTAFGKSTRDAFSGSADVIGAKELAIRNVTSPISAIEGKATGVQFTSPSGQPGSSPGIVIRGVGTLNGSTDPLIIVDGIQFDGALATLSQDDIESLTVLKDASSTSLYGSRAANGVILITTKSGNRSGGIRVSANAQYGFVAPAVPFYPEVSPGEYYEVMWEALKNSSAGGGDPQFASNNIFNNLAYNPFNVAGDQIVGVDGRLNPNARLLYQGLDWYDVLQQNATRSTYGVNVSGGGKDHSVFFSASYLDEEGFVKTSEFDRLTTRLNAEFNANKWLTLGGSVNLALTNARGPSSAGTGSIVNPFGFAKGIGSIYPVYVNDQQGNIVTDVAGNPVFDNGEGFSEYGINSRPVNQGRHALQELLLNDERDRDNLYGFNFFSDIKFFEGLNLRVQYGRNIDEGLEKEYENNIIGDAQPTGRYSETRFRRQIENINQVLTYFKSFNNTHNFELTAGHESLNRTFSSNNALVIDQTAEGIYEFANFATPVSVGGSTTRRTLEGYFTRLNYNFNNKYYLNVSARRDGSSIFSRDARWGNFYAVGGSWRLDQEDFIKDISWINRLKLRASYGEVGNDLLGDFFLSQPRYSLTSNAQNPGIYWSDIGNNQLQWETIENYDVAVEYSLFNNLLDGSVEYYRRNSSDLLYNLPIALSNGQNAYPANIGDMYNDGFEFMLTANLMRKKDFSWSLTAMASTQNNKITSLPDPVVVGSQRWIEGRSRYDFWVLHTAGVDAETGDQLYYKYEFDGASGETVPVLDNGVHATTNDWQDTERAYVNASSVPDILGSFSNSLNYKGFSLDFLFNYGIGGDILDFGYAAMMHSGNYGSSLHPDILNAWRQPGDITDVPRMENGNNNIRTESSRFLTDASFMSFRNLNFGYNFGSDVAKKLGMSGLRISVTGENLKLWSKRVGLNPQYELNGTPSGNDFNPARFFTLGINANF
ncbi:TonB-linked outer membrane protein, SusC/RagA family [Spirosomataceae bacterium TFI 002]|nr:TonB-linked outer membrane protein, SusC/RagA family [Spirosomataceae bacterium TFI 002]